MSTSNEEMYEQGLSIQLEAERIGPVLEVMLEKLDRAGWKGVHLRTLKAAMKIASDGLDKPLADRTIANLINDLGRFGLIRTWGGKTRVTVLGRHWLDRHFNG